MGDFDKKKAFGIGGLVTVLSGLIAVLANLSEIAQFFNTDKPEKSVTTTSIVETVEKNTKPKETKKAEEKVVEPETEPQPKAVYLDSLKIAEKSYDVRENVSGAVDTIGNTYAGHILIIGRWCRTNDEDYAIYYLGGNYKTLSGTIAVDDSTSEKITQELSILCDDNIVYTTGSIDRTTVPIEFSVSVEGCQWLKISKPIYSPYDCYFDNGCILSNWKLEE